MLAATAVCLWLACGVWAALSDATGRPSEWTSDDWLGATVKTSLGPIALIIVGLDQ